MKALNVFASLVMWFVNFPISIYMSWLMYQHVHATDIMWFLWWFYWPVYTITSVISIIVTVVGVYNTQFKK